MSLTFSSALQVRHSHQLCTFLILSSSSSKGTLFCSGSGENTGPPHLATVVVLASHRSRVTAQKIVYTGVSTCSLMPVSILRRTGQPAYPAATFWHLCIGYSPPASNE